MGKEAAKQEVAEPKAVSRIMQGISRVAPGLLILTTYDRNWLRYDVLAGVSVCAILIPQGLAYGDLAGVEPVAGLYAALVAMLAYALFATSRHLMVGPESGTAILVASTLAPIVAGDSSNYAALAALLALLVGGFLITAGLGRVGFVADYLSKPVLVGYMNGAALIIMASQLGKLFGISLEEVKFFPKMWELILELDQTMWLTLGIGTVTIFALVLLRRFLPKLPSALIVLVPSIMLSAYFNLEAYGVSVLGFVPAGLPSFKLPVIGLTEIAQLIPGALSTALLIFPDSVLGARTYAAKHKYEIDVNQELVALGAENIASGLFQGYPVGASQSRTSVNDSSGGKTQLVGMVAAAILAMFLLFFTALLYSLPNVTLAAIIMVAALNLINVGAVVKLWSIRRWEGILAVITTLGVLTIGMVQGILVAVVLSLFYLISKISRPHDAVLGKVEGLDGYHDIDDVNGNENVETVPGLIVYRFDAQLFFANAPYFLERVRQLVAEADPPVKCFLLNAEAISGLDTTAADVLMKFHEELEERGIVLWIARTNAPLRSMLKRTKLAERIGEDGFFPSVRTGVDAFKKRNSGLRTED